MKIVKKWIKTHKSVILAVFLSALMFSTVYGLIGDYHPSTQSTVPVIHNIKPELSNIGETGSVSLGVNYWTQSSVSNSGTNVTIRMTGTISTAIN